MEGVALCTIGGARWGEEGSVQDEMRHNVTCCLCCTRWMANAHDRSSRVVGLKL